MTKPRTRYAQAMSILSTTLGFVHKRSQRTGYVIDGPFGTHDRDAPRKPGERIPYVEGSVHYDCIWDDTGLRGEVRESDIEWIPQHKRHITDGVRVCHCGPSTIEGIVVHRGSYEQN